MSKERISGNCVYGWCPDRSAGYADDGAVCEQDERVVCEC